jgi:hypothetical protein
MRLAHFEKRIQTIREKIEKDVLDLKLLDGKLDSHVDEVIKSRYSLLIKKVLDDYDQVLNKKSKLRPKLGNEITILYLRDRMALLQVLFPEIDYLIYQAGKAIGKFIVAPNIKGSDIQAIFKEFETFTPICNYGFFEIVKTSKTEGVYRIYECADCYGLPNIKKPLCRFEAGITAGTLEERTGLPAIVDEVRCWGLGDHYCEFHATLTQR